MKYAVDHPPPRLGILGVSWIGERRMCALVERGVAKVSAIADCDPTALSRASMWTPGAVLLLGLEELLACNLDGVVIATPSSSSHADQAIRALEHGVAVFCQKPLACSEAQTQAVLAAAQACDRLLFINFRYRHVAGMDLVRELIRQQDFGKIQFVDLVFHKGCGSDLGGHFVENTERAGGGCLMDLGGHLIDLALWLLDWPRLERACGRLYCQGTALQPGSNVLEDFAHAELLTADDARIRLACSWRKHSAPLADIQVRIHGSSGGAWIHNVDGSPHEFKVVRCRGSDCEVMTAPPDDWSDRALASWARRLAIHRQFAQDSLHYADTARVLDALYGR